MNACSFGGPIWIAETCTATFPQTSARHRPRVPTTLRACARLTNRARPATESERPLVGVAGTKTGKTAGPAVNPAAGGSGERRGSAGRMAGGGGNVGYFFGDRLRPVATLAYCPDGNHSREESHGFSRGGVKGTHQDRTGDSDRVSWRYFVRYWNSTASTLGEGVSHNPSGGRLTGYPNRLIRPVKSDITA